MTRSRIGWALSLVVSASMLPGCSLIAPVSGAFAGLAAGASTANPAVAVGVAIGVNAVVDATVKTVQRDLSHDEQSRIASLAGEMTVGEKRTWEVRHFVPYADSQGDVTVVGEFKTPLAACKRALFRLTEKDGGGASQPFVTTVCQGAQGWQWAVAEPAVARWGSLQ